MKSLKSDLLRMSVGGIFGLFIMLGISDIVDTVIAPKPKHELVLQVEPTKEKPFYIQCHEQTQCRVLAEAIFFEARGEPTQGQYAVAFTVINRRDSWRWPDTVNKVVHQRIRNTCQYSYVCELNINQRINAVKREPQAWAKALNIAYETYNFIVKDFTSGSDHYYNPRKVSRTPKFAIVYDPIATIGNHKFYRSKML